MKLNMNKDNVCQSSSFQIVEKSKISCSCVNLCEGLQDLVARGNRFQHGDVGRYKGLTILFKFQYWNYWL